MVPMMMALELELYVAVFEIAEAFKMVSGARTGMWQRPEGEQIQNTIYVLPQSSIACFCSTVAGRHKVHLLKNNL